MQCHMRYLLILTGLLSCMFINVGLSQIDFWTPSNGPKDVLVNSIAVNSSNWVYAGTNKGVYRTTDHGSSWTGIGLTDSIINAVAIGRNGQIFAGLQSMSSGLWRSTDEGVHWISVRLDTISGGIGLLDIFTIAVDQEGDVLAGGWSVYRSADDGQHWTAISLLPTYGISPIVPVPSGLIFAACGPQLFRSTDHGIHWEGLNAVGWAIGYDQTGYIYTGNIDVSGDNGNSWVHSDSGHPGTDLSCFASNSADQVFAGYNPGGIFRTTDNGISWQAVNGGLTSLWVLSLAADSNGYLYAGTNGGGIFRSKFSTTEVKPAKDGIPGDFVLEQNYPNPFNPSTTIRYTLPKSSYVTLTIYDILGRELNTLVNAHQEAGYKSVQFNENDLPSGIYFYRLQAGTFTDTKKLLLIR